jgi:hypothetical protein
VGSIDEKTGGRKCRDKVSLRQQRYLWCITISVAEPHHFYADPAPAPAPGEIFDAAPAATAPAPAPTLLYSKAKFLKRTKG